MAHPVLVIDGDPDHRDLISLMLASSLSARVVTAPDAAAGIALAVQVRPAVILVDTRLPDRDGLGVARLLKDSPASRSIPLIGTSTSATRSDVLAAGYDDFVAKPF